MSTIRSRSLEAAASLGCDGGRELPDLEAIGPLRPLDEVRRRCLALFGVVSVAFGLDRASASNWLAAYELAQDLTPDEARFVSDGSGDVQFFRGLIEALWALAWVLEVVGTIDWSSLCSNDFIRSFPDPRSSAISSPVANASGLRTVDEVHAHLDLAYLLHHCHIEAAVSGIDPPHRAVPLYAVSARRHALEWVATAADWDDIELDT